jgi:hypothetical protein
MTGLISFVLLVMGGLVLMSAGMLKEEGRDLSANFCLAFGFILLLCAWWLA